MRFRLIILIITAILASAAFSEAEAARPKRTSKTVQKERKEAGRKIEQTKSKISANTAEIARNIAALERIDADIRISDGHIAVMSAKVDSLTARTKALTDSVEATRARVASLKASYGSALRAIRNQRQVASTTAFIFSSRTFAEARKRLRYLGELSRWQKEKAVALGIAADELAAQTAALDSTRAGLATQLEKLKAERRRLKSMHSEADGLVAGLRKQGRRLEKSLAEQQQRARNLDKELDRIIEEEARKAAEEERRRKAAEEERRRKEAAAEAARKRQDSIKSQQPKTEPAKPAKPQTPKQPAAEPKVQTPAAGSFEAARGKLPMPVSGSAVIVSDFGRHAHSRFEKVEVQNNGIDIEATPGAHAVAVYPGVVSMIIVMDGYHNVVLVRHGEYLTVYAGIASLAVRKGQEVKAGQDLGIIYSDPADDMRTRLHFEVRKEKEKLDPALWLK